MHFERHLRNIILCILKGKGKLPFKMHKIIFFSRKNKNKIYVPTLPKIFKKKYVCLLPYLKFSDPLPETHLFFFIMP